MISRKRALLGQKSPIARMEEFTFVVLLLAGMTLQLW